MRPARSAGAGADAGGGHGRRRTPEGYYQLRGGIPYAIAKSLAAAPFADILWMETKTADWPTPSSSPTRSMPWLSRQDAGVQPLPSFNWDTTGMSDDEMRRFPEEIGKMGFVFNFMTYGGHQIDGVAAEEFAGALKQDGMLSLARLAAQDAPGRVAVPHTADSGRGPRDAALAASSGRTATTKSMGEGSRSISTSCRPRCRRSCWWLAMWSEHYQLGELRVQFRPLRPGGEVLELGIYGGADGDDKLANVLVDPIKDRNGRSILRCATRTRSPSSCGRSG